MYSISKILIANRGEIARRIIRTSKNMDISTLAIYTDDEISALHVREADESCSIGKGTLQETFLNIPAIVRLAKENHCDAIHPGYGFLSENADFAGACKEAGIIFIGPEADAIRLMGNKTEARRFVNRLGIPLPHSVQGTSYTEILAGVKKLRFPLIIKAAAGGGGKGMKIVHSPEELKEKWISASREAQAYFGDPSVYLEEYIENARHIEVQIMGDKFGNVVHLYERECSIQRRHQKIIEEAPSPALTEQVRQKMLQTAVYIAGAMNYTNSGTIEFLVDKDLNFYFLEMNTRIQVEHPVTEAITGIDIVREQISIACGNALSFTQNQIVPVGHAMECRIYAEDPFNDFLPSSGPMLLNHMDRRPNIRIDSAFEGPATISSLFDPMIAKVIAHTSSRSFSISELGMFLKNCAIHGIKNNLEYLTEILEDKDFRDNHISTGYCYLKGEELKRNFNVRIRTIDPARVIASLLAYIFHHPRISPAGTPWQTLGPWRNMGTMAFLINQAKYTVDIQLSGSGRLNFTLNEKIYGISRIENHSSEFSFYLDGTKETCLISQDENEMFYSSLGGITFEAKRADTPDISVFNSRLRSGDHHLQNQIISPLNGRIVRLNVKKGDIVKKGDVLIVIESMKMENKILAPAEAVITDINVAYGDQVIGNELLIKLSTLN